jgi:pimeloyl-ACP methyl ester carboxylesterase
MMLAMPSGLRTANNPFPPLGQLIDLGGYRLHLLCSGAGQPTVVLEAGLGDSCLVWAEVQRRLSLDTRVCSYDRAGFGWSDPGPKPRCYQRAAEELHELLARADEKGPFVLVGHSAGVNSARLFAETYPEEVAGLVLIEPPLLGKVSPLLVAVLKAMRLALAGLSRLGIIHWLMRTNRMRLLFGGAEPPPEVSARTDFLYRPQSIRASMDEIEALPESFRLLDQSVRPGAWRDWPVSILLAYRESEPGAQKLASYQRLAALSSRGHLVQVKSSHFVHFEHPDAVVQAIEQAVQAARKSSP